METPISKASGQLLHRECNAIAHYNAVQLASVQPKIVGAENKYFLETKEHDSIEPAAHHEKSTHLYE